MVPDQWMKLSATSTAPANPLATHVMMRISFGASPGLSVVPDPGDEFYIDDVSIRPAVWDVLASTDPPVVLQSNFTNQIPLTIRTFEDTQTANALRIESRDGATRHFSITGNGRMSLGGNMPNVGGAGPVMALGNVTTAPTLSPTGGGIIYVSNGALMYRGTSGTITTLAPA
jgi:hypothetical protein